MSQDPSERRFTDMRAAFERAWHAARGRQSRAYTIAGARVAVRVAGDMLACDLHQAVAHLRAHAAGGAPALAIDLWDVRATGVAGSEAAGPDLGGQSWRIGAGTLAASSDNRFIAHALRSSVAWLDRKTQRIVGWYADADDVSLHQRGKPLQMLLAVWAADRGVLAVHAACVARAGVGVLLPGRSGSGKSTAALACVQAGLDSLGDDWIGIDTMADAGAQGYGLYSSTFLNPQHATRFPTLTAHLIPPRDPDEEKALLFVGDVFPDRLRGATTIRAIALPRVIAGAAVRVRPAAKRDALLVLIPSTVFEMYPRTGRAGVERLAHLVQQLPVYWLEMGSDLTQIPARIEEILATT